MRDNRRWSPDEKRLLAELWPTHTCAQIAARLKRSASNIKGMVRLLRLPLKQPNEHGSTERVPLPDRNHWRINEPFTVTVHFLFGWLSVYGTKPLCAECGEPLLRGQGVQWTGRNQNMRLSHACCHSKAAN
jgi:hypothetical protein